jgi:hypothetical protein
MVFDYGAMGEARASGELTESQRRSMSMAKAMPASRKQHGSYTSLRDMYDQTAISFEGMEFVKKLGGA